MFKISNIFGRKNKEEDVDKKNDKIIINDSKNLIRVAIIRDDKLDDFFIQEKSHDRITGNIYKGRVEKVVKSIQAAFVNIGLKRNGFLHISDMCSRVIEDEEFEEERNSSKLRIEDMIAEDDVLLVQVIKDHIGTKGVRLSTNLSLPGRYVVFLPKSKNLLKISKKIKDNKERERLSNIIKDFKLPKDSGIIVRTAAENKTKKLIHKDIKDLIDLWTHIKNEAENSSYIGLIHEEIDIARRVVRDMLTENISQIIVDTKEKFDQIQRFIKNIAPKSKCKVKHYKGVQNIFEKYGIESELKKILSKKVWLKCGGYIIIEKTEALVSIDVNTGRNVSGDTDEDTIFQTNLEATEEIARQLRLRNLGGIIIVDYIDMKSLEHKKEILKKLKEELLKDKSKTTVYPFTKLGLLQMTRQRVEESWEKTFFDVCPHCHGTGRVKSASLLVTEIIDSLKNFLTHRRGASAVIKANPRIISSLKKIGSLDEIEKEYNTKILIMPDDSFNDDRYEISAR